MYLKTLSYIKIDIKSITNYCCNCHVCLLNNETVLEKAVRSHCELSYGRDLGHVWTSIQLSTLQWFRSHCLVHLCTRIVLSLIIKQHVNLKFFSKIEPNTNGMFWNAYLNSWGRLHTSYICIWILQRIQWRMSECGIQWMPFHFKNWRKGENK